jgi:hypothetical protein
MRHGSYDELIKEIVILQFRIDPSVDPDRSNLRSVLEAEFAYERMSAARSLFFHLLAIVSVLIWLEAIWPDLLPSEVRLFIIILWGTILFVALWAAIEEYFSRRRLKRHLAAKKGVTLIDGEKLL